MSAVSSPILSPVADTISAPISRLRYGQQSPPRTGLLFYAKTPNGTGGNAGKYVLTAGSASIYAATGSDWYTDVNTPLALTDTQILALASCNDYHILYSAAKGLAIYDPYTTAQADIDRAHQYYRVSIYADDVPTAFFNGVDFTGSAYTGGPTYVTDNTGALVAAPARYPGVQGARLATTLDEGAVLGPEIVINGDFASWVADNPTNYGILNENASNYITESSGKCRIVSDNTSIIALRPNNSEGLVQGKTYLVSFDIISITGSIQSTPSNVYTSPGTKTYTYTTTLEYFQIRQSGVCDAVIDNLSIKEVIPQWLGTDASGNAIVPSTPQRTRTGNADFSAYTNDSHIWKRYSIANPLTMPGWLCEPARTNYRTYSNTFSSWDSIQNITLTSGQLFIGNTMEAWKFDCPGGNVSQRVMGYVGCIAGVSTLSMILKAGTINIVGLGDGTLDNDLGYFNLSTGIATKTYATSCRMSLISDGWYLCEATWTSSYSSFTLIYPGAQYAGTGQSSAGYFYGAHCMLESGGFATSYIPTTTAAATRAGTVNTYSSVGKIRPNNVAFRVIAVPRASGQDGAALFSFGTSLSNRVCLMLVVGNTIRFIKRIADVEYNSYVSTSISKDVAYDIIFIQSSIIGTTVAIREIGGSWINGSVNNSAQAKGDMNVSSTFQLGALLGSQQFVGNISLFEALPLPSGLTDPLTYAKQKWGIS